MAKKGRVAAGPAALRAEAGEERRIVEGCARGDYVCFERLVERYERKIYNLALRMMRDPEDAREVLQETFLKVYDNMDKFRGASQLSTWIYRIAMNEALMKLRKSKRRAVSLDTFNAQEEDRPALDPEDGRPRPLDQLLTRELGERLDKAIALLPEDYRGVFLLRDVEGLSNEQIAKAMKLTVPAVKSRIHRARLFLRNELSPYLIKREHGE